MDESPAPALTDEGGQFVDPSTTVERIVGPCRCPGGSR